MKKKSYHHKNLRAELLELTAKIIAEDGLDHVTLRELARRLGVSRTAPYRHFKDKNALLAKVAETKFQGLNIQLLTAFEDPSSGPLQQFEALAFSYLTFAVNNYDLYRLMFSDEFKRGEIYPGLAEAADETFAILAQTVIHCQDNGLIRADDPSRLAFVVWSTLHGIADLYMEGKLVLDESAESFFHFSLRTLVQGLAVRREGASPPLLF